MNNANTSRQAEPAVAVPSEMAVTLQTCVCGTLMAKWLRYMVYLVKITSSAYPVEWRKEFLWWSITKDAIDNVGQKIAVIKCRFGSFVSL